MQTDKKGERYIDRQAKRGNKLKERQTRAQLETDT